MEETEDTNIYLTSVHIISTGKIDYNKLVDKISAFGTVSSFSSGLASSEYDEDEEDDEEEED